MKFTVIFSLASILVVVAATPVDKNLILTEELQQRSLMEATTPLHRQALFSFVSGFLDRFRCNFQLRTCQRRSVATLPIAEWKDSLSSIPDSDDDTSAAMVEVLGLLDGLDMQASIDEFLGLSDTHGEDTVVAFLETSLETLTSVEETTRAARESGEGPDLVTLYDNAIAAITSVEDAFQNTFGVAQGAEPILLKLVLNIWKDIIKACCKVSTLSCLTLSCPATVSSVMLPLAILALVLYASTFWFRVLWVAATSRSGATSCKREVAECEFNAAIDTAVSGGIQGISELASTP